MRRMRRMRRSRGVRRMRRMRRRRGGGGEGKKCVSHLLARRPRPPSRLRERPPNSARRRCRCLCRVRRHPPPRRPSRPRLLPTPPGPPQHHARLGHGHGHGHARVPRLCFHALLCSRGLGLAPCLLNLSLLQTLWLSFATVWGGGWEGGGGFNFTVILVAVNKGGRPHYLRGSRLGRWPRGCPVGLCRHCQHAHSVGILFDFAFGYERLGVERRVEGAGRGHACRRCRGRCPARFLHWALGGASTDRGSAAAGAESALFELLQEVVTHPRDRI